MTIVGWLGLLRHRCAALPPTPGPPSPPPPEALSPYATLPPCRRCCYLISFLHPPPHCSALIKKAMTKKKRFTLILSAKMRLSPPQFRKKSRFSDQWPARVSILENSRDFFLKFHFYFTFTSRSWFPVISISLSFLEKSEKGKKNSREKSEIFWHQVS